MVVCVSAFQWGQGGEQVKVFILAGQSNMEGHGRVEGDANHNEGKGSLSYLAENEAEFGHLRKGTTGWVKRDDVSIWYLGRKGELAPGYGARNGLIGPELGFGHVMGEAFEEPVLLIKTAWGGKSLAKDFRPPGAGGEVGPYFTEMIGHVKSVLENLKKVFPQYKDGYEIVGFGWHQGWNDGCNMEMSREYAENLKHFIRDVRKELGVENLPFVIADSGFGGEKQANDRRLMIREAQAAPSKDKEFKDTVACVSTAPFFRTPEESPSRQGYHWNGNAGTYYLMGEAMGEAMKTLVKSGGAELEKAEFFREVRSFRNTDGSKSFKGRLLEYDAGTKKVKVQRTDGKTIVFDLSSLHPDDQESVKSTFEK